MAAAINPQRGEARYNAKLTEEDIILIRKCVEERERLYRQYLELSNRKLAEKFDVHYRTIEKVAQHSGWIHV